ncbi:MAG: hydrolase 1, exosortase A system-associated [Acidobacteriales bacterium]|nr:hydrolase 1, exosortase A system-associated [Terriglobales bacterium]
MIVQEVPVDFRCGDARLYAVLHRPSLCLTTGLLILHGRPAYRVGGHRLFVQLARRWAQDGYPVFRADYRGSGDCEGGPPEFQETSADISAAVDAFFDSCSGLERVVFWGSCGGAADAALYARHDPRISALVLLNPWSFDPKRRARRKIGYHAKLYLRRMAHPQWWAQVLHGHFGAQTWLRTCCRLIREAAGMLPARRLDQGTTDESNVWGLTPAAHRAHVSYREAKTVDQIYESLVGFPGQILLILSGEDTNAKVFVDLLKVSPKWRALMSRSVVQRRTLPGADHGLRRPQWRNQVDEWTLDWMRQLGYSEGKLIPATEVFVAEPRKPQRRGY